MNLGVRTYNYYSSFIWQAQTLMHTNLCQTEWMSKVPLIKTTINRKENKPYSL